jgi:hypothetical protein
MKAFQTLINTCSLYDSVVARVEQSGNLPCAIAILEWIRYFKGSLSLDDMKEAIEISLEDESWPSVTWPKGTLENSSLLSHLAVIEGLVQHPRVPVELVLLGFGR